MEKCEGRLWKLCVLRYGVQFPVLLCLVRLHKYTELCINC
jgi:hypothetical protein